MISGAFEECCTWEKVCTQQYVMSREVWRRWNANMKPQSKQTFVLCWQKVQTTPYLEVVPCVKSKSSDTHTPILRLIKEEESCFKRTSGCGAGMSYPLLSKLQSRCRLDRQKHHSTALYKLSGCHHSTTVGEAPYSKRKNAWYTELPISRSYFCNFSHDHSYLTTLKPCQWDREIHEMQGFNKWVSLGEAESGISEQ